MKTEEWLLANHNVSGYYRVNYDQANWDRLLDTLNTAHQVSPGPARHGPGCWR